MLGLTVLLIVLGVPVTLIWWRMADRWAGRERGGRAHTKPRGDGQTPTVLRVERDADDR